jgi:hypothetical protein
VYWQRFFLAYSTLVQGKPTLLSTFLSTSKWRFSPRTTGKVSLQQGIFSRRKTFQALKIQALTLQNTADKTKVTTMPLTDTAIRNGGYSPK